jgi:prepilin-type N-terminal cleavage/methylation domain-containing protein
MKKNGRERGFALIEVLLAVVIVAVGLVFVLRSFSTSVNALKASRDYYHASEVAARILDDLASGNLPADAVADSTIHVENRAYHVNIEPVPGPSFADLDVQEVSIRIRWENGNRELDLSTLVKR